MKARRPLVSVVLPSYNHERFVAQAIESVFAQTYPAIELVVIDDGSKDGSAAIIRKTLERAPKGMTTRFFERSNGGAHAAINFGLENATGEFLTILNSDDYFHPERLETLVSTAKACGSELLFTMLDLVSEKGERLSASVREVLWYHEAISLRHYLPSLGFALIRDNLAVTTGNLFFTRALSEKVGPFRPYRYVHDIDFILRALLRTEPKLVPKTLLYYRLHTDNTIRDSKQGFDEEGRRVLNDYMKAANAGGLENRFAPCPAYWPRFFNRFIAEQRPFFATTKISTYLEESGDLARKGEASAHTGTVQALQAIPALSGVCIHLLDHATEPAGALSLLGHDFKDEKLPGKAGIKIGTRYEVRLTAPALPEKRSPKAIALVLDDRILATAEPGPFTETGLECVFVVAAEFGGLDLRRTSFQVLEEAPEHPGGFALHARSPGAARLDYSSELDLEPIRVHVGERAYEIRSAATDGRIDRIRKSPKGGWILEGTAYDTSSSEGPTGVLLFDGETRVPASYEACVRARPDGASDRVGFKLSFSPAHLSKAGTSSLRAVAIFQRGVAFHLGLITRKGAGLSTTTRAPESLPEQLERITRTASGWRYDSGKSSREWVLGQWRFGFIDVLDRNPARISVHGWALEPPTGQLPEAILIASDGKPVAFSRPNVERLDLIKVYKLWSPLIAGFKLDLDPALAKTELKTYALWPSGVATELPEYGAWHAARQAPRRSMNEGPQLSI